ncbi:UvrD-helicase domain-containing protein [Desulfovibrio subterraneus]|uniref:DNA 3'-5' helicase n=1 Tax=Desulfovibrio subterraneus TaxID=2718620 RepID=A0A7J0BIX0_9BACT|nr:UvrD-helicase domain-containing protein [Desulfovibrio subterraneus]GFM33636.1 DNA helicase [Desulfovibrio subterraneus]
MLQQIKASAGSGKTYTLTRQFLTLLKDAVEDARPACAIRHAEEETESGHSWPEILAVTFTNKAATEMRERIVRSLKERALDIEPRNAASDWDAPTASRWVDILLRRYSSLNVRTIDSLLNMLVRLSALELGLPPDFEPIFDEKELFEPLYDRLLDAARAGGPERDLLADACRSLLMLTDKEGFVPGETLRTRLYGLMTRSLQEGTLPDADGDVLRGWLVNLHGDLLTTINTTKHLMEQEGLTPQANFTKYMDKALASGPFRPPVDSAYAGKPHIDDCLLKASKGKASDDLEAAYSDLCHAHAALAGPGHLVRRALILVPFVRLAEPLSRMVHEMQQTEGKVPASLWPSYARDVLSGETGASEAFCRMGTRLTHLLIDEFQDTSIPQWEAIQPLAVECLAKNGTLTYVGDVKQAIYGWRGGDSALFESILNDPELRAIAPDPKRTPLPNNWRSRAQIVEFNNGIFSRLAEPETARAFASSVLSGAPDRLVDAAVDDIVQGFAGATQDVPEHKKDSGGYVHLYDVTAEGKDDLLKQVEERLTVLFRDELIPRRPCGDIAVLVRTNDEAALVAEWLVNLNLPVITENSLKLADHPLVTQTVAFLRFLDYPPDDMAFWEFVSGRGLFADLADLSPLQLDNWLAAPRDGRLFSAFRKAFPGPWRQWIAPFYSQAGLMSAYDTVRELYARTKAFERFPDNAIFLRRFLEVVFAAEERGMRSLSAFLDQWTESGGEEKVPMPENVDAVRVMTMHKSKGLEFPVAVIPFHHHTMRRSDTPERVAVLGQEIMVPRCKELGEPYYKALAAEAREQLHLLYVAWTRPVDELHAFITTSPFHESQSPMLVALRLLLDEYGMGANRDEREPEAMLGTPPVRKRTATPLAAPAAGGISSTAGISGSRGISSTDASSLGPAATSATASGSASASTQIDTTTDTTIDTAIDTTTGAESTAEHDSGKNTIPNSDQPSYDNWKPMQWLPRLKIFRNPLKELVFDERRRGTLVHACLERLRLAMPATPQSIMQDVQRAVRHGMKTAPLPIPDRDATQEELSAMLHWLATLPEFPHWQQYGTPEQSIMDAHGSQHRTDLLVDDGTTLTVVEYKTGQPSSAHKQQVSRYMNLLAAIPAYSDHTLRSALVYLDARQCILAEHSRTTSHSEAATEQ